MMSRMRTIARPASVRLVAYTARSTLRAPSRVAAAAAAAAAAALAYQTNQNNACRAEEVLKKSSDGVSTSEFLTLNRYILSQSEDKELATLLIGLTLACKATSRACCKAGIAKLFGLAGEQNATGDDQKKLDVLSNDIFIDALVNCGSACVLVSEENEEPIFVPKEKAGRFVVAFDPLDGSSNIDCNVSTGTIFGVYAKKSTGDANMEDVLRKGDDLIVAGYCMYGAATEMVLAFKGRGVHRFTLDPSLGEFIHTDMNVKLPDGGGKKIYSTNEGNSKHWDPAIRAVVEGYKTGSSPYAARYVGSMVSDVHRTILYGGIYLYPADKKSKDGKLRVLYEGFPMAMIVEAAGGAASCGLFKGKLTRLLDIVPTSIHERCPVVIGCKRDVEAVLHEYKKQGLA